MKTYKPNQASFFLTRAFWPISIGLMFWVALFFIMGPGWITQTSLLLLTLIVLTFILLFIQYKKEIYSIDEKNGELTHKHGSIFSDSQTQLNIQNITHVKLFLPFINHSLFGAGNLVIQSAGSLKAEIRFSHLDKPEIFYQHVQDLMGKHGFSLSQANLVQQEKPSNLAIVLDLSQKIIFTLSYLLIFTFSLISDSDASISYTGWMLWAGLAVLLTVSTIVFLRFLDLRNRVYSVYQDVITFYEGFLTKRLSFIPIQNLNDSTHTQSFLGKIFKLYDITLSCQGAGQEIHFKNMLNGPKLEDNIDQLIQQKPTQQLHSEHTNQNLAETSTSKTETLIAEASRSQIDVTYLAKLSMNLPRAIFPLLFLTPILFFSPFFAFFIFPPLIIRAVFTKFHIKEGSVRSNFSFLTTKDREFKAKRVTAITFTKNIIDKLFSTTTITFHSLGSAHPIVFANIKDKQLNQQKLLQKFAINIISPIKHHIKPNFSLKLFIQNYFELHTIIFFLAMFINFSFRQNIALMLAINLLALLGYGFILFYLNFCYQKIQLSLGENYLSLKSGLLIRKQKYVLYEDIKDLKIAQIPFSDTGSITLNIAGDITIQQKHKSRFLSNTLNIQYLPKAKDYLPVFQYLLLNNFRTKDFGSIPKTKDQLFAAAKPSVSNAVTKAVFIHVGLIVSIFFLPFSLVYIVWSHKKTTYQLHQQAVLKHWGVVRKQTLSVLFARIDHINLKQGFLNKIFKNGSIEVNTVGSSLTEMKIANISQYQDFYRYLQDKTKNKHGKPDLG